MVLMQTIWRATEIRRDVSQRSTESEQRELQTRVTGAEQGSMAALNLDIGSIPRLDGKTVLLTGTRETYMAVLYNCLPLV